MRRAFQVAGVALAAVGLFAEFFLTFVTGVAVLTGVVLYDLYREEPVDE